MQLHICNLLQVATVSSSPYLPDIQLTTQCFIWYFSLPIDVARAAESILEWAPFILWARVLLTGYASTLYIEIGSIVDSYKLLFIVAMIWLFKMERIKEKWLKITTLYPNYPNIIPFLRRHQIFVFYSDILQNQIHWQLEFTRFFTLSSYGFVHVEKSKLFRVNQN